MELGRNSMGIFSASAWSMRVRVLVGVVALANAAAGAEAIGDSQTDAPDKVAGPFVSRPHFVVGEVIVKLRGSQAGAIGALSEDAILQRDRANLSRLHSTYGVQSQGPVFKRVHEQARQKGSQGPLGIASADETFARSEALLGFYVLKTDRDVPTVCAELNRDPAVEFAQPNYLYRPCKTPNDPEFPDQYAHQLIQMEDAWDISTGSRDIVVAVLGTGVDVNHPDLKDNIWVNPGEIAGNKIDDDGNGYVDDLHGWDFAAGSHDMTPVHEHETEVAGVIGAVGNNGKGVCTVYPLPPDQRATGRAVYLVLDFGREVAGMPKIRVSTKGTGTIDLGYGELLEGGNVNPHRHGVNYADRYIMKPGEQEWEVFDRRAFRYMQIDFRNITEPVTVESVSVNFNTYPVEWKGEFACSDTRLNDIWRIGAYTVQLNMEDAYTDCPWRERTQWWGDARIEAMSNYYAFGDHKLMRQGIIQIGQSQNEEGRTACFYPGVFNSYIPSFCLIWVGSIWDYYTYTGDAELVKEMYPKVEKLIGYFEKFRDKNGLISNVPGWMFIEWTQQEYEGTVSALNCFYYETLTHASNMARIAGDPAGVEKYAGMAEVLKSAINTRLYDPERGAYPEYWSEEKQAFSPRTSQMVNGLVAAYDIAPDARRKDVLRYCMDPAKNAVPAGSYFAYYYLQALLHNGYIQESLDYMRKNWGVMLDWGATTFWEHWNTGSSLCHGWASAPTTHLPAYILGVRPAEPGFKRATIAPNTGDLRWARGTVPTPLGLDIAERSRDRVEDHRQVVQHDGCDSPGHDRRCLAPGDVRRVERSRERQGGSPTGCNRRADHERPRTVRHRESRRVHVYRVEASPMSNISSIRPIIDSHVHIRHVDQRHLRQGIRLIGLPPIGLRLEIRVENCL